MASADIEEYPQTDIVFRGTDGKECEAFVAAIQELAFVRRKDDDSHWILRYARTRLRGKAIRWHASLNLSIRKDWDLFVQALFEEYPFVEEPDRDEIATPNWTSTTLSPPFPSTTLSETPAPHGVSSTDAPQILATVNEIRPPTRTQASHSHSSESISSGPPILPPVIYDPSVPGPHFGRLRVIYQEGRPWNHYVCCSRDTSDRSKNVTFNIEEALIVSFIPFSKPHEILCTNPRVPSDRKLAVRLFRVDVAEYHPMVGTSSYSVPTTSTDSFKGQIRLQLVSKIWNVLADGTLQVTLADLSLEKVDRYYVSTPGDSYVTTSVYVDISGQTISFTKDHFTPRLFHPDSKSPIVRARIVFEPL